MLIASVQMCLAASLEVCQEVCQEVSLEVSLEESQVESLGQSLEESLLEFPGACPEAFLGVCLESSPAFFREVALLAHAQAACPVVSLGASPEAPREESQVGSLAAFLVASPKAAWLKHPQLRFLPLLPVP